MSRIKGAHAALAVVLFIIVSVSGCSSPQWPGEKGGHVIQPATAEGPFCGGTDGSESVRSTLDADLPGVVASSLRTFTHRRIAGAERSFAVAGWMTCPPSHPAAAANCIRSRIR